MAEMELINYLSQHFKYKKNGTIERSDRKNATGSLDKDGYLILKIKGKQHKAHRVIYAMHNGRLPTGEIDHINGIRNDNRIENLRQATRVENIDNTNRVANKQTGEIGIYIDNTKGLKKKFTTKLGGKMFRFYSITDALDVRKKYYSGRGNKYVRN